jgi:IclR family KDG regulon transcriptional repressor
MMANNTASKPVKQTEKPLSSLSKGLALMLKLKELSRPLGLSEAARLLGFNKATTFRVLATLERYGFVERDDSQRTYKIGASAFSVGAGYLNVDRRTKIRAVMRQLVSESGHTVTMSVLDGVSVIFVERLDGTSRVRVTVEVGSRAAAHASASGKVLLAELGDIEVKRRFKGEKLRRLTNTTITSFDQRAVRHISAAEKPGAFLCCSFNNRLSIGVFDEEGARHACSKVAFSCDGDREVRT